MKIALVKLVVCALFVVGGQAHAGLIHVEAADGYSLGELGLGINTVSGSMYCGTDASDPNPGVGYTCSTSDDILDAYDYFIGNNMELVSVDYKAFGHNNDNNVPITIGFTHDSFFEDTIYDAQSVHFTLNDLSKGSGHYNFSTNFDVLYGAGVVTYIDYTLEFVVRSLDDSTTVPEPSTLAIFALGMIGLASRRFKKQS